MLIERKRVNPNVKMALVELSKKNNLESFYLSDGIDAREAWVIVLSIGLFFLAAAGGAAFGWLLSVWFDNPGQSLAYSVLSGSAAGLVAGWRILDRLLDAAAPNYEAHMREQGVSPNGRSFPKAANSSRRISLSENDQTMLQVFAARYPMVKTLSVNEWEGESSPLVFEFMSKRDAIKRIQAIVIALGYGVRDGRGGVQVTDDFEKQIANWQNAIFEDENET